MKFNTTKNTDINPWFNTELVSGDRTLTNSVTGPSSTLTVSWLEEEGTSQASIMSKDKRRKFLSARYPVTCDI
jgi:hypothetical protein